MQMGDVAVLQGRAGSALLVDGMRAAPVVSRWWACPAVGTTATCVREFRHVRDVVG